MLLMSRKEGFLSFFFFIFFQIDLLLLTHILFSHHLFYLTRTNTFKTCRNLFVVNIEYRRNKDMEEYMNLMSKKQ